MVEREAEGQYKGKGADQGHWNRNSRHQRGLPVLQEQEQDQHHQDHCVPQGIGNAFDRLVDEVGDVVDLLHPEANRQSLLKLAENLLNAIGDLDRVTSGELINRDAHRRRAFEIHGIDAVDLTAELNPPHILKTHQATGIGSPQDDVLEFLGTG